MVQVSFLSFLWQLWHKDSDLKTDYKGVHVYLEQVLSNQPNPTIFAIQDSQKAQVINVYSNTTMSSDPKPERKC